jgi:raffinose/stachyose/melibiose transport system permease protein
LNIRKPVADKISVRKFVASIWIDAVALIVLGLIFVVPFMFIFLMAAKTRQEAALFEFSWPSQFQLLGNIREVMVFGALVAFVMQRRADKAASVVSSFMLAGLIIPPAVVPTIFLLQWLGIYKTLFGMIMVDVAYSMPFAILVLRAFMGTIPRELDEAAIIDGASPLRVFFFVILPLLRPAIVTVVVTSSVTIFNDFVGPLYFLPGAKNVTAPLTLFSFTSQFLSQWNLLFADVVIITIIPLIVFLFFQRQLISGMTSGAIKG